MPANATDINLAVDRFVLLLDVAKACARDGDYPGASAMIEEASIVIANLPEPILTKLTRDCHHG